MPVVLGEYTPPPAAGKPCCSACSNPERRRRRRVGAAMVSAVARSGGGGSASVRGLGDPLFVTPTTVKALVEQANAEIWALAKDYSKGITTSAINHDQLAAFKIFFNEWLKYYDQVTGWSSWIPLWGSYTSGSTYTMVQQYRSRAADWRALLQRGGGTVSTPAPTNLPPKGPGTDWGSVAKWVAGGAIVLGGALALGHVTKLVPKLGS